MSELADFILARIEEEERECRARLDRQPATDDTVTDDVVTDDVVTDDVVTDDLVSPGRLLLHCLARRKLVALHEIHIVDDGQDAMLDGESRSCRAGQNERDFICPTLRMLALPYFDHADYQQRWQHAGDLVASNADLPSETRTAEVSTWQR
ncbi:MAG TPA: DUF6221 family protein [Jatrophihabitans sp.]|jgi:hypothetical protein